MTTFKGHKTGFKPGKSNTCAPNESGPPKTKFTGRPSVPAGPLKMYPSGVAEISDGNRRLAKTTYGDGGGSGTRVRTTGGNAFGRGRK